MNSTKELPLEAVLIEPGRAIADIVKDLNLHLKTAGIEPGEYDFNDSSRYSQSHADQFWPARHRWIACYPVTGSNEGYYVHIDVMSTTTDRWPTVIHQQVAVAKTWSWDNACLLANAAARLLGA